MDTRGDGSIFRAKAVQRYREHREKPVLPTFLSPRSFSWLWLLTGLLLAGLVGAGWARIPSYTSVTGVVVAGDVYPQAGDPVVLAVLAPAGIQSQLREGGEVLVQLPGGGQRISRTIAAVEPDIISPDAARARYRLAGAASALLTAPSAVAFARLGSLPMPPATYLGAVCRVDVAAGSQRLGALLPVIGALFKDRS